MRAKPILIAVGAIALLIAAGFAYRSRSSKPEASAKPINTNQYLETEVQKRLADSGVFTDAKISVVAHDGTVTLTGTVPSEWKRISAGNIASSTPAVLAVENLIVVPEPAAVEQTTWASANDEQQIRRRRAKRPFGLDDNDPQSRARELVAQGNYYVAHKQYRAAVNAFRSAIALDPNNYEARSGLQEAQRIR